MVSDLQLKDPFSTFSIPDSTNPSSSASSASGSTASRSSVLEASSMLVLGGRLRLHEVLYGAVLFAPVLICMRLGVVDGALWVARMWIVPIVCYHLMVSRPMTAVTLSRNEPV